MRKTYIYKAKINKTAEANCNHWLELCRILYNIALEQRIIIYKQWKKYISYYDQNKQLPKLKEEFPEFKVVDAQCLQDVLFRLNETFKGFFQRFKNKKGRVGFPRFKNKNRYDSFTLVQNSWKFKDKYLYVKNIGRFKLFLSRPIEGNIKTVTIRKSSTNKWFVSFSCDNVPKKKFPETTKEVGIDVGINSFCVDSDGNQIKNPKYLQKSLKVLRIKQRSLSRKKKGSVRRNKTKLLVAKIHEKISNQRKDFLHKVVNSYINKYKTIYIEDLNISGMVKNKHLSRNITDSSWGIFFNFLLYKAEEAGRAVIKVSPNNTSQICSGCGEKVPKSLSIRIHNCPFCSLVLDRDLNASLNIKRFGQNLQALTDEVSSVA